MKLDTVKCNRCGKVHSVEKGCIVNKENIINKLKKIQEFGDTEGAHSMADGVLCDFLESLGYKDIVDEYDKVEKWYA